MKCPNCSLLNPENAERCDCGYDFPTQTIKDSYFPVQKTSLWNYWPVIRTPVIFIAIGPPVGFGGFFIQSVVTAEVSSFTARDFWIAIALTLYSYVFGAIPALCSGIAYGMVSLIIPRKILRNFLCRILLGGVLGAVSTKIYCQVSGLNTVLVLWAGLPAGAVCALILRPRPPAPSLKPVPENLGG
jgi:uncharacterized membrane protein YqaE (UPF0057 family)